MNDLKFEVGSLGIDLNYIDKSEILTFKDNAGKNNISLVMDKDTIVDILSGILYLLPPKQTEYLAERLVYDCFSSEKLASFLKVISREQVEFENDKKDFEIRRLLLYSKKL